MWGQGDFNYDGSVDTVDFNLLTSNFSLTLAAEAASPVGALIPEPPAASLLAIVALLPRRRDRRNIKSS